MPTPANTNIVSRWLKYNFYTQKFNTTAGLIVMGLAGVAIAYAGAVAGPGMPLMIACAIAGILFCIICFRYPLVGFYSSMFFSSLLTMPDRITPVAPPVPLGMCVEALQYLTLLSIIAKQYRLRTDVGPFWRNPLTLMFLVLLAYYIADVFNPVYHSKLGWFNYVRKQFSYFAFYYMAYILMDSYGRIRQFIKIWLIMALVIALYGIKQQWFGLTTFELQWYQRNPDLYALSFQSGFLRKPSLLSDPASFGVLCATTLLFTLVMAARTTNRKRRYQYLVASLLLFLGSSYSGTRSCNLMIVAGVMAYGLFTMNEKRTYTIMIAFVLVGAFILFGPFRNNPVVYRISSTFQGNKDASAMVRSVNRHRVQPYLQVHPMGGGIFTCGFEGAMYNKGHYLWNFQPDSGFMKTLAEQGYIGLALLLIFYYIFLRMGIKGFYHSVNPRIKNLYVALTISLFTLIVGQYSQVAIATYPMVLFYFTALIILYKLKNYDTPDPGATDSTKIAA